MREAAIRMLARRKSIGDIKEKFKRLGMTSIYNSKPILVRTLTQGSIFCNAVATQYRRLVYGLVITARCDMAHDGKVDYVYYLPIIDLEDWFVVDGMAYLWKKEKIRAKEKLQSMCEENHIPFDNQEEAQLMLMANSIQEKGKRNQFVEGVRTYFSLCNNGLDKFEPNAQKKSELIKLLCENKHADYLLVKSWEQNEKYKVILMRDLKRIKYELALRLQNGVEEQHIENPLEHDLCYTHDKQNIYHIVTEMNSPYVEYVMQHFSHNFCRIGIEDMSAFEKDKLVKSFK